MTLFERLRRAVTAGDDCDDQLLAGDFVERLEPATPAAVLIAVVERPRPGLLLTQRTAQLRAHAGQVAFPGGRIDPGDASPEAAALREAHEEIGLDPARVTLVGALASYHTGTGYDIVPVIGIVPPDLPLAPNPAEVAALFEVPLDHVLDRANHVRKEAMWRGRMRSYLEIGWEDRLIWGATAAMLANLSRRLDGAA